MYVIHNGVLKLKYNYDINKVLKNKNNFAIINKK